MLSTIFYINLETAFVTSTIENVNYEEKADWKKYFNLETSVIMIDFHSGGPIIML